MDDVHQNSPPVVLRGHVYSVVVPSAPSSESSSSLATREDQNRRRRRSFLVKLEAQFGDDGQKWQALEASCPRPRTRPRKANNISNKKKNGTE